MPADIHHSFVILRYCTGLSVVCHVDICSCTGVRLYGAGLVQGIGGADVFKIVQNMNLKYWTS